jgi:hypothetical protein
MIDPVSYMAGIDAAAHLCEAAAAFVQKRPEAVDNNWIEDVTRALIIRSFHQQATSIRGLSDLSQNANAEIAIAAYTKARRDAHD